MKATTLFARVALLWLLTGTAWAESDSSLVLSDFTGQTKTLESYTGQGKWLVVMIWAADCHVCNTEAEGYAQFHEEHKLVDAQMLGISLDGAAKKADAEAFLARHDLPFTNLISEPQTLMLYYSVVTGSAFVGTPSFLLFDPTGKLTAAQAGAIPPASIERFISKQQLSATDG